MVGTTLARYLALAYARAVLLVFGGMAVLIYLVDFVEMLRRSGDAKRAGALVLAWLSLLRTPAIAEQLLPFAVLFGSMLAFIALTRRLELIVARAAGLSAWQFLGPPVLVALLFGALGTAAYNPLAATLKRRADATETRLFGASLGSASAGLWLRQKSVDGQAILRADRLGDDRLTLEGVTAFVFDTNGAFVERVGAPSATLQPGFWRFIDARIISPDAGTPPREDKTFLLATNLSPDQLTEASVDPEEVPFWSLPAVWTRMAQAGLDPTPLRLRFQTLLARPLLLVTMVLIAAVFSLRFFRFGGVARMASSGVAAGFLLYVVTKLTADLGGAGILGTGVAAWSPAIVGTMLATFVLLHQEDG